MENICIFLLMHVRQWSDIARVKSVFAALGPEFEVVSLDVVLTMAAEEPTLSHIRNRSDSAAILSFDFVLHACSEIEMRFLSTVRK